MKALPAAFLTASLLVTGCATSPPPAPSQAPAPAPAIQSLQQLMQEAAQAAGEGQNKERARDLYRTAARNYPASKEPWVKLAEDYFEAGNYGQAILAAQEVIQRDPQDSVASSVLAVSGLRVSAAALATLRDQNTKLAGGTRSEAQTLAKLLRDALGEAELVPQGAAPGTGSPAGGRATSRGRPSTAVRPVGPGANPVAPSAPAQPPSAREAPPRSAATAASAVRPVQTPPPADPFKILKK